MSEIVRNYGALPFTVPPEEMGFPQAMAEQTDTIYRNYELGKILDQGNTYACVGYALAALLQAEPFRQSLDPKKIYREARELDNTPGEGVALDKGVAYLGKEGYIDGIYWTLSPEEVVSYINNKSPVIFSTPWFSGMDKPEKDGRIVVKGSYVGAHAYMGFRWDGLKKRLWIVNSYGEGWGLDGTGYITYNDLGKLLRKDAIACALLEKRPS